MKEKSGVNRHHPSFIFIRIILKSSKTLQEPGNK